MDLGTGRALSTLVGVCLAACTMLGCQNKLAEDNRNLHSQNRELQAALDESHRKVETPPAPVVQPPPPAPVPPPVVVRTPVEPLSPVPTPVAPKPDLGSLESVTDVGAGTTTVSLPGDVFFDPGKDTIKDSAKPVLDKVVAALKKEYSGKPVRVEGYTDTDPIKHSHWKSNQELSEARAKAVRDYLALKGVDVSRLSTRGFGETKPKATKALSRRVEVVVLTK